MKSWAISIVVFLASTVRPIRAATIAVINTNDAGPGSLRAALVSVSNGDTIDASGVTGTITLLTGELLVSDNVSIVGPGPSHLAVDGNRSNRAFHIASSNTVTLSSLTISNAAVGMYNYGGGIEVDQSTLTVSNCVVTMNSANSGGGILNNGTLTVVASQVCSNSAPGLNGGGIENNGTLTVIASTISDNSASEEGGGIYSSGWPGSVSVTVIASTISGNSAGIFGGGIDSIAEFNGSATTTVSACTLSGNSAGSAGGGIRNEAQVGGIAIVRVLASTFSGNSAVYSGGGVLNESDAQTNAILEIGDTILNSGASGANLYSGGGVAISRGYNLSSDSTSGDDKSGPGGYLNSKGDIRNTDPELGPLQDNGGPTFTQAPSPCSPAVDQGKLDVIPALALNVDQRGQSRPVDDPTIANAAGGDGSDIGAVELQAGVGCPGITLSPASLPDGVPGVPYEQTIAASGSAAMPLCFLVTSGALPTGLSLNSSGVISGVPCGRGVSQFTLRAADTNNCVGVLACTLAIKPVSEDCADLTGVWSNLVQTCGHGRYGSRVPCTVRGTLIVENVGGTTAPSSVVRYYLCSTNQVEAGDLLLKQQRTGIVKPNKPRKLTLSTRFPRRVSASGQFIIAVVNADNTVAECNVCNNVIVFGPVP